MEYVCGNIFLRPMMFAKSGDTVDGHSHNFDHTTYCPRGAMRVESLNDDGTVRNTAVLRSSDPLCWVLIEAKTSHRITALEDNTIGHCIYAHRTPQGDIVQEYSGWAPAYE